MIWMQINWPESQIYMDKDKYPDTIVRHKNVKIGEQWENIEIGSVLIPIKYINTNNAKILKYVWKQLKKGGTTYKKDVPLDGSRNHIKDALEESVDLAVYISARLIEINETENESDKNIKKTSQEEADSR